MRRSESRLATCPLRIFVVEDDPAMQEIHRLHLQAIGHTVSCAFDVKYALQRLASWRCDVLIVDIGLPDGDGWELLGRVKFVPTLFAVALTARNFVADQGRSRMVGFRRHFAKPLHLGELGEVLREAASALKAGRP